VAVVGGIGLYELGRSTGRGERVAELRRVVDGLAAASVSHGGPEAAERWLALMRNNDITRATRNCFVQEGRTACSIALWMETSPSPSATVSRRPGVTRPIRRNRHARTRGGHSISRCATDRQPVATTARFSIFKRRSPS
jgi:hypothetical protein